MVAIVGRCRIKFIGSCAQMYDLKCYFRREQTFDIFDRRPNDEEFSQFCRYKNTLLEWLIEYGVVKRCQVVGSLKVVEPMHLGKQFNLEVFEKAWKEVIKQANNDFKIATE